MLYCISKSMFRKHISSPFTFVIYTGQRGIGKTTAIHDHIANCEEVCQWDYIHISAKSQLADTPLSAIAMAEGMNTIGCDYFTLYKDITAHEKCILHIENPDEINPDAMKLLDNAIRFLLNSGNSDCKVIMEYDHRNLNVSLPLTCMTHTNTLVFVLSAVTQNTFISNMQNSYYALSCEAVHKIAEVTHSNFGVLNKMMMWLLSNQIIVRKSNGVIDCSQLNISDIDLFIKDNIEEKYSQLSDEQNRAISQASIVGNKVYTFLLQDALAVRDAMRVLDKISTTTNLLSPTPNDGLYHFLQNIPTDYMFTEGVREYVLSHVPLHERYCAQKKLADYLEVIFSQTNNQYMNESHMLLLARYYAGINISKEIEYMHMAAASYENKKLPASAAVLYWKCYTKNHQSTECVVSAIRCWLQAEQYENIDQTYTQYRLADLKEPWINLYYAKAQYCIGNVQRCLETLKTLSSEGGHDADIAFHIHSLMASSYDWMNDSKLRKRHFILASKIAVRLADSTRELALCSLWKKCTMCQSFELAQVKRHMIYAYQKYKQAGELCEAFECALNIGNEYLFMADFANAYKYISDAYEGFLTIRSRQIYVAHNSLGILFMVQGSYANALRHFNCINVDTIEPFCRISVEINKVNAHLKLHQIAEAKEIIERLGNDSALLSHPDMQIVAAHYYISVAYISKAEHNDEAGIFALNKAMNMCDAANENFSLLLGLCVLLQEKWTGKKPSHLNCSLISKLCCQKEITICDIMCWR